MGGEHAGQCPHVGGVAFDPMLPEQAGEPFPWFAVARKECPIFYLPRHKMWCVTRFADVRAIMRDTQTYSNRKTISFENMSSDFEAAFPEGSPDRVLVTLDPPEHGRIRRLAGTALSSTLVESRRSEVRGLCEALLDGFKEGSADIVAQYSHHLPVQVITRLVGAPVERTDFFLQWATDRMTMLKGAPGFSSDDRQRLVDRALEFNAWLQDFIVNRRANPENDLASALIHAVTPEGDPALSVQEVIGLIAAILGAGSTSTGHLIVFMLRELLGKEDLWRELFKDRSLVPAAIEETLRFRTPVYGVIRTATRDVQIDDVTIPEGADLYLSYASAHRDEEAFEDPDHFDVHRKDVSRHMAFGRYVHICLGAQLARLEAEETLNAFLDRFPTMKLVENQAETWTPNLLSPGLDRLEVTW